MPDKEKKPDFVVTDRRLFSAEGELRHDVVEDEERRAERDREQREAQQRTNEERAAQKQAAPAAAATMQEPELEPPSAQEQKASAAAYEQSARDIDAQIESEMRKQGRAHRAQDFQVSFERFVASLYMSALVQLGLAAPQGEKPDVDLIGARQTIDTIAMLQEKTKGNLTPKEDSMIQSILYELRMAYLEVTNLIANPPQPGAAPDRAR